MSGIDVNAKDLLPSQWLAPLEYIPGVRSEVIIGVNPDIDSGTLPEDIWGSGGPYTGFPATSEIVRVSSSSAADAEAGTGARTVLLRGLDNNFKQISETVTLNGVASVLTVNSYRRLHSARVMSAGSGGTNAGTITVQHNVTTANIFCAIRPGDGVNRSAVYTVPAGFSALITRVFFELLFGSKIRIELRAKVNGVDSLIIPYNVATDSNREKFPSFGGAVSEKTDLYFRCTEIDGGGSNVICTAGLDIIIVERNV